MLPEEQRVVSSYDYAEKLADEVGYVGAGTVEFMYDLDRVTSSTSWR